MIREFRDQRPFDGSPGLIAVFRALRRLLAPRHPPHALSSLAALTPGPPDTPPAPESTALLPGPAAAKRGAEVTNLASLGLMQRSLVKLRRGRLPGRRTHFFAT